MTKSNTPLSLWLDGLVSAPTIGAIVDAKWSERVAVQDSLVAVAGALEPVIGGGQNIRFKIDNHFKGSVIERDSGYQIDVDFINRNVVSSFHFQNTVRKVPGGLPVLEFSDPLPYSVLQEEVKKRFFAASEAYIDLHGSMRIDRLGFLAHVNMDIEGTLPPGVMVLLDALSEPWRAVSGIQGRITATLSETEEADRVEQCHHSIRFSRAKLEEGLDLSLDWQVLDKRSFEKISLLKNYVNECEERAFDYFADFGSGSAFLDPGEEGQDE